MKKKGMMTTKTEDALKAQIKAKLVEARTNRDLKASAFWQDILWLANRRSTKDWTLERLIARIQNVNAELDRSVEAL